MRLLVQDMRHQSEHSAKFFPDAALLGLRLIVSPVEKKSPPID
jgi:hypothetical protein